MKYKHLFTMIKSTLTDKPEDDDSRKNSLVAFNDNSSVIKGFNVTKQYINYKNNNGLSNNELSGNELRLKNEELDIVLTAETHNFPTLICPFEGASTGIGGRIRDNHATGRGAYLCAGLAGYCVGKINLSDLKNEYCTKKYGYLSPTNILIEASNGASDYGNKIGEPIIGGFTRSFGQEFEYDSNVYDRENSTKTEHIEWVKPIMFTAGIGSINHKHLYKKEPEVGMKVVRIGGPAYKIGLGGGFSSSVDQDGSRVSFEINAVQRGDAQMENKLNRVITTLINLGDKNPIVSIHDQGAGGLANVVKEIVYPLGAEINLNMVTLGDTNLHPLEIWCSEFQESDVLICNPDSVNLISNICKMENVFCDVLGEITGTGNIVVKYTNLNTNIEEEIINLPLQEVLEPEIQKDYDLTNININEIYNNELNNNIDNNIENITIYNNINSYEELIKYIFSSIDVCSKRFLTNKVDRSVTGLINQQQCVGPYSTPLSNYSCISLSYYGNYGASTAIGERPYYGLNDYNKQGIMSVGEMVTNMMGSYIGNINNIKASVNWMWPAKSEQEKYNLYKCANSVVNTMKSLSISADGGKDSLSMSVKYNDKTINSPGSVVITGYSPCLDINKNLTPDFKEINSKIIYINLSNIKTLKRCFNLIQKLLFEEKILSLHDISDGGLLTTIVEMSISSGLGLIIDNLYSDFKKSKDYLTNEELGIVIEISNNNKDYVLSKLMNNDIYFNIIGTTINLPIIFFKSKTDENDNNENEINNNDINNNTDDTNNNIDNENTKNRNNLLYYVNLEELVKLWEYPSFQLEKLQANEQCVNDEYKSLILMKKPQYYLPSKVFEFCNNTKFISIRTIKDRQNNLNVAIIRDEGSNGDKEMCAVFHNVGFNVFNISMNELLEKPEMLREMRGIVYVGGFSHSDVLGSAHGWYISIKNNANLVEELNSFMYDRNDTFS